MIWLLANWRIAVTGTAIAACLWAGWYSHAVWDGYHAQEVDIKTIEKLKGGTAGIINFNQAWSMANVKDDCVSHAIPVDYLKLLTSTPRRMP